MGNWLHANGARIRALTAATSGPVDLGWDSGSTVPIESLRRHREKMQDELQRLMALQRQREPVYDAVFAEWWQAWAADCPQDAQDEAETASAADADAEHRATVDRLAEEDRREHPAPEQTLYEMVTGENLDTAVARFRAETEAAKGVVNS